MVIRDRLRGVYWLTAWLAPSLNLGAAVIGYLAYVIIHNTFTYCYYIPFVLKLNAKKIFVDSFLPVAMIGVVSAFAAIMFDRYFNIRSEHVSMIIRSGIFATLYLSGISFFFIKPNEMISIKKVLYS